MQPIVNQMITNKVECRKLSELRDTLLPKLMSGEIDASKVNIAQLNNHLADISMHYFASCRGTLVLRRLLYQRVYCKVVLGCVWLTWAAPSSEQCRVVFLARIISPNAAEKIMGSPSSMAAFRYADKSLSVLRYSVTSQSDTLIILIP